MVNPITTFCFTVYVISEISKYKRVCFIRISKTKKRVNRRLSSLFICTPPIDGRNLNPPIFVALFDEKNPKDSYFDSTFEKHLML